MQPIGVSEALDHVGEYATQICRRNRALIDFYIYPHPVPTEIEAYEPRLKALEARIKDLKKLQFSQLRQLIDNPDSRAAKYILSIIIELQNAIQGFRTLFEQYYDRNLSQRPPHANIYQLLQEILDRLHDMIQGRQREIHRFRAENQRRTGSLQFCKGAIQLINNSDAGLVNQVEDRDLLETNKEMLRNYGGCFLWWTCTSCDFKLRYHVRTSKSSSIENNNEIREHSGIPIVYRSVFLAKSHLFNLQFDNLPTGAPKYGCVFCFAQGRALAFGSTVFATGRELAAHICSNHQWTLPPPLMLNLMNVAVNGRAPMNAQRWDVNLHTN